MMKDYYAILGVTPQAEDIVIKAAYRALAQRYHPDRFAGATAESTRKMAEINEAYSILSDQGKRKAYDAEYQQSGGNEGNFEAGDAAAAEGVQQLARDWATALDYYPDLRELESSLAETSKSLAFTFRLFVISEKAFKNRQDVAETMHHLFLKSYFGDKPEIITFAKVLIGRGRKDAARALNEAVRVLGPDLEPNLVIAQIRKRFGLVEITPLAVNDPEAIHFLNLVRRGQDEAVVAQLAKDPRYLSFADSSSGNTALHLAIAEKNIALAKTLIERGAPITQTNIFGATPIDFARKIEQIELLRYMGVTT